MIAYATRALLGRVAKQAEAAQLEQRLAADSGVIVSTRSAEPRRLTAMRGTPQSSTCASHRHVAALRVMGMYCATPRRTRRRLLFWQRLLGSQLGMFATNTLDLLHATTIWNLAAPGA